MPSDTGACRLRRRGAVGAPVCQPLIVLHHTTLDRNEGTPDHLRIIVFVCFYFFLSLVLVLNRAFKWIDFFPVYYFIFFVSGRISEDWKLKPWKAATLYAERTPRERKDRIIAELRKK